LGGVALGGLAPGLVVVPGVGGIPLLGEFGEVGAVVPGPVDGVRGLAPGVAVLGVGVAVLGVGVAVLGFGVAAPGFGVAVSPFGVAAPGLVLAPCVFTVPSLAMHGVLLPGAVVPGNVLGGLVGVPGVF
jgi:hypothetical protein